MVTSRRWSRRWRRTTAPNRFALVPARKNYPGRPEARSRRPSTTTARGRPTNSTREGFQCRGREKLDRRSDAPGFEQRLMRDSSRLRRLIFFTDSESTYGRQRYMITGRRPDLDGHRMFRPRMASPWSVLGEINWPRLRRQDRADRIAAGGNPFGAGFAAFRGRLAPVIAPNGKNVVIVFGGAVFRHFSDNGGDHSLSCRKACSRKFAFRLRPEETLEPDPSRVTRASEQREVSWISYLRCRGC